MLFLEWLILSPFLWIPMLLLFVVLQVSLVESNNGVGAAVILAGTVLALQLFGSVSI